MFNWFIEDKGFCRSFAVDKRISDSINEQEKEELLCQFFFNAYIGKSFTEVEIVKKEMFHKLKEEESITTFVQLVAFEGMFLTVEIEAEKNIDGYKLKQIQFYRANEDTQNEANYSNSSSEEKEVFQKNDSAAKMRFIEATKRRSKLLEYCNVEKIDSMKYKTIMSRNLKGLFYYIDANESNTVKVIDTINKQRQNEMVANTTLEATLWLLGYEQEYIKLASHEEDIVNVICDTARYSEDTNVLKAIRMMNQKMFNDALCENPVANEII